MNKREFLTSMLALGAAPAIVRAGSLMRVKPILLPEEDFDLGLNWLNGGVQDDRLYVRGAPDTKPLFTIERGKVSMTYGHVLRH